MQTIICMKWGTRYGAEYVNRLLRSIERNTKRPTKLVCFTEDTTGVDEKVDCQELPPIALPADLINTPWRKISVWQSPLKPLTGDVLFLDLDLVITGDLDRFFDYKPGSYCVIENWTQLGRKIGNTSCFRFPVGKYVEIFDRLIRDPDDVLTNWRIEQQYISDLIPEQNFWPAEWCVSFKHNLLPAWPVRLWKPAPFPNKSSVVAFTGKPDPDEAMIGQWPVKPGQAYKKLYKQLKPVKWIAENWN